MLSLSQRLLHAGARGSERVIEDVSKLLYCRCLQNITRGGKWSMCHELQQNYDDLKLRKEETSYFSGTKLKKEMKCVSAETFP